MFKLKRRKVEKKDHVNQTFGQRLHQGVKETSQTCINQKPYAIDYVDFSSPRSFFLILTSPDFL